MTVGDAIQKMLDETSPKALLECINILYDNNIDFEDYREFVLLFIDGITENRFFEFVWIMKELRNGNSRSTKR